MTVSVAMGAFGAAILAGAAVRGNSAWVVELLVSGSIMWGSGMAVA